MAVDARGNLSLDESYLLEAARVGKHGLLKREYRGTSLIRNRHPVGPYSRTMSRAL